MSKDYYKILNLNRNATIDEIKKSYKKLALKYHPDKNQKDKKKNEERFKDISEAYQILSDSQKKEKYDSLLKFNNVFELTQEDLNKIFGLFKKPSDVFSDVFNIIPEEYQEVSNNLMNYFFEDKNQFNNDLNNLNFSNIFTKIKTGILDIPNRGFGKKITFSEMCSKMVQIVFYIFYYCSFYFFNKLTDSNSNN